MNMGPIGIDDRLKALPFGRGFPPSFPKLQKVNFPRSVEVCRASPRHLFAMAWVPSGNLT